MEIFMVFAMKGQGVSRAFFFFKNVLLKTILNHSLTVKTGFALSLGFILGIYETLSDVGEIRVYFASKILTPCRMH